MAARLKEKYTAEADTLAPEALLRGEVTVADIPTDQLDGWMNDPTKKAFIRPNRPGSYSYFFLVNFMPGLYLKLRMIKHHRRADKNA